MGILRNLFGGGPEKHEEKGDELRLDLMYRDAAFYYGKAIEALKHADDPRAERLRGKLREVRKLAAREMIEEAEELVVQGSLDLAREKLETAVGFSDDDHLSTEIERKRGEIDALLDRTPEEAESPDVVSGTGEEDLYDLALSGLEPADQERARLLGDEFRLGYEACQNERWDDALARLAPLLEKHPGEALLLEMVAMVHENRGDWAAAREHYQRAWDAAPPRPAVAQGLAAALTRLGRPEEARTVLGAAAQTHPADADLPEAWIEIHLEYARALAAEDDKADEALAALMPLFRVRAADQATLYYTLGGILETAGRDEDARQALEKAIAVAPRASMYRERMADFLVKRGIELDQALKYLVEANEVETVGPAGMLGGGGGKVLISPNRGRYLYKMARIYFLKGEDLEAERTITTALHVAKDPRVLKALEELRQDLQESRSS